MELEVDRRLRELYGACLKCLRETGELQDHHGRYGIHNCVLLALEAGAKQWETRMQIRLAREQYTQEAKVH